MKNLIIIFIYIFKLLFVIVILKKILKFLKNLFRGNFKRKHLWANIIKNKNININEIKRNNLFSYTYNLDYMFYSNVLENDSRDFFLMYFSLIREKFFY